MATPINHSSTQSSPSNHEAINEASESNNNRNHNTQSSITPSNNSDNNGIQSINSDNNELKEETVNETKVNDPNEDEDEDKPYNLYPESLYNFLMTQRWHELESIRYQSQPGGNWFLIPSIKASVNTVIEEFMKQDKNNGVKQVMAFLKSRIVGPVQQGNMVVLMDYVTREVKRQKKDNKTNEKGN